MSCRYEVLITEDFKGINLNKILYSVHREDTGMTKFQWKTTFLSRIRRLYSEKRNSHLEIGGF